VGLTGSASIPSARLRSRRGRILVRVAVGLVTPRLGEWVDADREFRSVPWWEAVR
jgi:hypothetical protein